MAGILFKIAWISHSQFKCIYLKNEKKFLNFLFHFWNIHQILNVLKEQMIVIANVFPILQTLKNVVRPLSKKPHFRTRFDNQHVKASQILTKSPWECFCHVFSSFPRKLICKMSHLVLGEILTGDGKCSVQDCKNLPLPIQMQLSGKRKTFCEFFVPFLQSTSSYKVLKEKMIVIANVFPKLQSVTNFFRPLSKKRCFRTRFDSQHMKASQIVAKSPWEHFYHLLLSFSGRFILKLSPLVLDEVLRVFVNTLTSHDKYRVQDYENSQLPIQMQLSEKRKTFPLFFVPFLESTSNFKCFEKKDDRHS